MVVCSRALVTLKKTLAIYINCNNLIFHIVTALQMKHLFIYCHCVATAVQILPVKLLNTRNQGSLSVSLISGGEE